MQFSNGAPVNRGRGNTNNNNNNNNNGFGRGRGRGNKVWTNPSAISSSLSSSNNNNNNNNNTNTNTFTTGNNIKVQIKSKPNTAISTTTTTTTLNKPSTIDRAERFNQNHEYFRLKENRINQRQQYIATGKMADPDNRVNLSNAISMTAECQTMCPRYEMMEREYQKKLDPMEIDPNNPDVANPDLVVKRFARSSAGDEAALPCDVRPPGVLVNTLTYLLHNVLLQHGLEKSYGFIRDRTRAIRNDFTLQNYRGHEAVECHERIARYHILCGHDLCQVPGVTIQQEHEQLRKTLQSLREFYDDAASQGIYYPNEAEFQAYYILSHLFQCDFVSKTEKMRKDILLDPQVQLAIELQYLAQSNNATFRSAYARSGAPNNYASFFQKIKSSQVSFLMACVLHIEFVIIRRHALKSMQKSYYSLDSNGFTLEEIASLLGLGTTEKAYNLLTYHEIPVENISGLDYMVKIGKLRGHDKRRIPGPFVDEQEKNPYLPHVEEVISAKRVNLTDAQIVDNIDKSATNIAFTNDFVVRKASLTPRSSSSPQKKKQSLLLKNKTTSQFGQPSVASSSGGGGSTNAGVATKSLPVAANNRSSFSFAAYIPKEEQEEKKAKQLPSNGFPSAFAPPQNLTSSNLSVPNTPQLTRDIRSGQQPSTVTPFGMNSSNSLETPLKSNSSRQSSNFSTPSITPIQSQKPQSSGGKRSSTRKRVQFAEDTVFDSSKSKCEPPRPAIILPAAPEMQTQAPVPQQQQQKQKQLNRTASTWSPSKIPDSAEAKRLEQERVAYEDAEKRQRASQRESLRKQQTSIIWDQIAREIMDELVESQIQTEIDICLSNELDVSTVRGVYNDICEDLIYKQVVPDLVSKTVKEAIAEQYNYSRILRFQWKCIIKWSDKLQTKLVEQEKELKERQRRAVNFYINAVGMESGMFSSKVLAPQTSSTSKRKSVLSLASPLPEVLTRISLSSNCIIDQIDLSQCVGKVLAKNPKDKNSDLYWKLLFSTPPGLVSSNDNQPHHQGTMLDTFAEAWLIGKFIGNRPFDSDKSRLSNRIVKEYYSINIDDNHPKPTTQKETIFKLCVTRLNASKNPTYPLKENAYAVCSGINAAIFQLSTFQPNPQLQDSGINEYWKKERTRLYSFISNFPSQSKVPLLLLHWSQSQEESGYFKSQCTFFLNLGSTIKDGPISVIDMVTIPVVYMPDEPISGYIFDHDYAREELVNKLKWLGKVSSERPVLLDDSFGDLIKPTERHFEFLCKKVSGFSSRYMCLNPVQHCSIFNALVDVFNFRLKIVEQVLSHPILEEIAYPAVEWTLEDDFQDDFLLVGSSVGIPRLNWNTRDAREEVSRMLKRYHLAHMKLPSSSSSSSSSSRIKESGDVEDLSIWSIKEMYEAYINELPTRIPHVTSDSIWRLVEPSVMSAIYKYFDSVDCTVVSFPFFDIIIQICELVLSGLDYEFSHHQKYHYLGQLIQPSLQHFVDQSNSIIKGLEDHLNGIYNGGTPGSRKRTRIPNEPIDHQQTTPYRRQPLANATQSSIENDNVIDLTHDSDDNDDDGQDILDMKNNNKTKKDDSDNSNSQESKYRLALQLEQALKRAKMLIEDDDQ